MKELKFRLYFLHGNRILASCRHRDWMAVVHNLFLLPYLYLTFFLNGEQKTKMIAKENKSATVGRRGRPEPVASLCTPKAADLNPRKDWFVTLAD